MGENNKDQDKINYYKLTSGPLAGLICGWLLFDFTEDTEIAITSGIIIWMALWWMLEAVNIYYTALLPVFLFPLFGILDMDEVSSEYMNQIIFLFIGGFLIAYAFEKSNLHKRISLKIILLIGSTFARVVLGVMIAAFILSMWMGNTATAMLLIPSVMAIIKQMQEFDSKADVSTPLLLGMAYAASIGGLATVVGSPPNLILLNIYNDSFPELTTLTFSNWMAVGFPLSLILLFICFYLLKWRYFSGGKLSFDINLEECKKDYEELGKVSRDEKIVQIVFDITVFLWFFLKDVQIGDFTIPGWTSLFDYGDKISEGTVAMLMASILFLIPSQKGKEDRLLTWDEVQKIPLGILFLFGGGFSIALAMKSSGLSDFLAEIFQGLGGMEPLLIMVILTVFIAFLSEVATNTAAILLLLPIIISISEALGIHPLYLMLPVTLAASCGFMLPVATPPNVIAFSTDKLKTKQMRRTGFILKLIAIILVVGVVVTLGELVFDF